MVGAPFALIVFYEKKIKHQKGPFGKIVALARGVFFNGYRLGWQPLFNDIPSPANFLDPPLPFL